MIATEPEDKVIDLSTLQKAVYWDDRRFVVVIAGRGAGKSWAVCNRMIGMIERREILDGALILVLAPTYPQLKIGAIKTFDRLFGAAGLILETINGNEPERRLIRGITVIFRNASNPDQTRGGETQIVWLDEAAQLPSSGALTLTNMNNRQFGQGAIYQTFISTTPRGRNWLWRDFINEKTAKWDEERVGYYHMTTEEAIKIGVAKEDYIEESGYTPGTAMYEQEILGKFVSWSGNVFHFQPERDTPEPFILPQFKTVVGGIDIGTTAPTAVVLVGIDQAGRYWVFREYYQRRADFHDVAKLIGEWHREFGVRFWSIDAAANLEYKMLRAANIPVRNSLKAKDAAGTVVNFVNSLMERDMFRVSPDCIGLIAELETYEHKEQLSGDEVTFLDKVKPNQPDHAIDAMRYAIAPLSSAGQVSEGFQTSTFRWVA